MGEDMEFYTIAELASKWRVPESLICKWAGEGSLKAGVFINNYLSNGEVYKGFCIIPTEDMLRFVSMPISSVCDFVNMEGNMISLPSAGPTFAFFEDIYIKRTLSPRTAAIENSIKIDRSSLMITVEEASKFRADNPEFFTEQDNLPTTPDNVDDDYPIGQEEICGWRKIKKKSGMSEGTFRKYAEKAEFDLNQKREVPGDINSKLKFNESEIKKVVDEQKKDKKRRKLKNNF